MPPEVLFLELPELALELPTARGEILIALRALEEPLKPGLLERAETPLVEPARESLTERGLAPRAAAAAARRVHELRVRPFGADVGPLVHPAPEPLAALPAARERGEDVRPPALTDLLGRAGAPCPDLARALIERDVELPEAGVDVVLENLLYRVRREEAVSDPAPAAVQLVGERLVAVLAARVELPYELARREVLGRHEPQLTFVEAVAPRHAADVGARRALALEAAADVPRELARVGRRRVDGVPDLVTPVVVDDREDVFVAEVDRDADVLQRVEVHPRVGFVAREARDVVDDEHIEATSPGVLDHAAEVGALQHRCAGDEVDVELRELAHTELLGRAELGRFLDLRPVAVGLLLRALPHVPAGPLADKPDAWITPSAHSAVLRARCAATRQATEQNRARWLLARKRLPHRSHLT